MGDEGWRFLYNDAGDLVDDDGELAFTERMFRRAAWFKIRWYKVFRAGPTNKFQ